MSKSTRRSDYGNSSLEFHRRQIDALSPPEFKNPRFDEARKMVVDLIEGRKTDVTPPENPITLASVNTDTEELSFKRKAE